MERRLQYLNHLELKKLVPGRIDAVIVPVGTIEAHGIIPLGTDVIIPERLAETVAAEIDALTAPAVAYGITRGLAGHPGTVTIGPDVFSAYIGDLLGSLARAGFRKIVVLNGHGGQSDRLRDALFETTRKTGAKGLLIDWWRRTEEISGQLLKRQGGHAGADETACIMAIDASLVKPELYDDTMVGLHSAAFTAYPFPGSIITYGEGDTSLNLDREACAAYLKAVARMVTEIIREVFRGWEAI